MARAYSQPFTSTEDSRYQIRPNLSRMAENAGFHPEICPFAPYCRPRRCALSRSRSRSSNVWSVLLDVQTYRTPLIVCVLPIVSTRCSCRNETCILRLLVLFIWFLNGRKHGVSSRNLSRSAGLAEYGHRDDSRDCEYSADDHCGYHRIGGEVFWAHCVGS